MNRINLLLLWSLLSTLVLSSCTNTTHTSFDKSEPERDLTAVPEETCSVPLNMDGLPPRPDSVATSLDKEPEIVLRVFPPETCPQCIGGLIPLPDFLTIGGTRYEIKERTSISKEMISRLPSAYRFQPEQLMKYFDKSLRYWFESDVFLRSPDGKFALPFSGNAPFVGYLDFAQQKFICFTEAFPPTGEEPEGSFIPRYSDHSGFTPRYPPRYEWTGVLAHRPKPPTVLWLFVHQWNREKHAYSSHWVSIPLADPGNLRVERLEYAVVRVFAQAENEILGEVSVGDNWDRYWARISTDSWAILAKGNRNPERGHLSRVVYSPDQSEIYAVYSSGLVIFDAKNGFEKVDLRVGGNFNAFIGATFDPSGSVAVVSTPSQYKIALIDVKSHQIISQYRTASPLAGIIFDEKTHKAYAYSVDLPGE